MESQPRQGQLKQSSVKVRIDTTDISNLPPLPMWLLRAAAAQVKGLPTGRLTDLGASTGVRGWGHAAADTLDKVPAMGFQSTAALRIALHMATREDWPVRRISEARVEKVLGPTWIEVLKLESRWPSDEFASSIVWRE